ncbi:MAG TPA: MauE/DoxX family redox-associated membrane protein [Candidatus Acidoferrales bacterium]
MTSEARGSLGRILLIIGRLALAGIFLFAAYAKLKPQAAMGWSGTSIKVSLSMFAMQVDSYQLLPPQLVSPAAHFLPLFELFLGLWLLSGILLRYAALTTTLLLGAFFAMMVRTYRMGLEINCGCFGPGERLGVGTLLRDGSLLAFAIAVTIGAFVIRRRMQRNKAEPATASSAVSSSPQHAG